MGYSEVEAYEMGRGLKSHCLQRFGRLVECSTDAAWIEKNQSAW